MLSKDFLNRYKKLPIEKKLKLIKQRSRRKADEYLHKVRKSKHKQFRWIFITTIIIEILIYLLWRITNGI